nr:MAG TPA: hypothetical protein [Bacteriophage sp.]DAV71180.1 MAG TPA: hypothetical protein [Bacteriophage sp.]
MAIPPKRNRHFYDLNVKFLFIPKYKILSPLNKTSIYWVEFSG